MPATPRDPASVEAAAHWLAGSLVGGLLGSLLSGDRLELRPSGIIGSVVGANVILLEIRAAGGRSLTLRRQRPYT